MMKFISLQRFCYRVYAEKAIPLNLVVLDHCEAMLEISEHHWLIAILDLKEYFIYAMDCLDIAGSSFTELAKNRHPCLVILPWEIMHQHHDIYRSSSFCQPAGVVAPISKVNISKPLFIHVKLKLSAWLDLPLEVCEFFCDLGELTL